MREQEIFLFRRAALSGVPLGELEAAAAAIEAGQDWARTFVRAARRLCQLASRAQRERRERSAVDAWQWSAAAFHAASYGLHVSGEPGWYERTVALRRLASQAHRRALALDRSHGEPVEIPGGRRPISGYLREPASGTSRGVVVMVNGLDSMTEVELHAFGAQLVARGFSVLGLDLPAGYGTATSASVFDIEADAPAIADWVMARGRSRGGRLLAAFGVSFGGHLVARLLSGEARFSCGVAVSPNAYFTPEVLAIPRIRRIVAMSFRWPEAELEQQALAIDVRPLPRPAGDLLILAMKRDALFGPEHVDEMGSWAGPRTTVWHWDAEHVGTSCVHEWLPRVADWLGARAAGGPS